MPGQHVDQVLEAAKRKLYYKPLTDLQVMNATDKEVAEDERLKANNDSIGSEVFRDIEGSNLTPQEKQEVHQSLARYGMEQELQNPEVVTNPNTLLRGNSRYTNYSSAYLNHYAQGYVESVRDLSFESSLKTPIPKSVVGKVDASFKVVENAYTRLGTSEVRDNIKKMLAEKEVSNEVLEKLDALYEQRSGAGKSLRQVNDSLQHDVKEFLRQNGVQPDGVDQEFQDHHTKMSKVSQLAGGQIPQEDLPPNGELLAYMDKHELSEGMTAEERQQISGVLVADFQTLHKIHLDVAHNMVDATAKNLSQLTPEARDFLQSAFGPITDPKALNMAVSSTMVLRLATPKVTADARNLNPDPSTVDHGVLLERGVKTVQRYVNTIGGGGDKVDYATLGCSDLVKDQALKDQTLDSYKALGEGQNLDTFSANAGGPLTVDPGSRPGITKLQQSADLGSRKTPALNAKLQTEFLQIQATKTKLEKLNKPGINLEKFKAFFGKGGIAGAKTATQNKMQELQRDLDQKLDEYAKGIAQKKEEQLLKQAQSRKQKLNELPSLSHDEAQDLMKKLDKLSPERNQAPKDLLLSPEEVDSLLKGLEKLKGSVKQKKDSLSLSQEEAEQLHTALDRVEGLPEKPKSGSLELSGDDADKLLKKLDNIEEVSQDEELDGFYLSDTDYSDLLGKLKDVSPESWEQVEEMVDTDLSVDEIGDLIKELEELDLDETPKQTLDGKATTEEIGQMIKELEELDLGENQEQTLKKSQSVGSVLHGDKQGAHSPKPKVGSHSLRSEHPELTHEEGQAPKGPGVKLNTK